MHVFLHHIFDFVFPPSEEELLVRSCAHNNVTEFFSVKTTAGVIALSDYRQPIVRALIHEAKFHQNTKAFDILGTLLSHYVTTNLQVSGVIIIPIPLSKRRLRERGYNQVTEIIKHAGVLFEEKALARMRHTQPQTELQKEERGKNVAGAFAVINHDLIAKKHVMLIDDVLTTGATMQAAKAALLPHNPASITCIALAH